MPYIYGIHTACPYIISFAIYIYGLAFVFLLTQLTNTSPPYTYTVNTSPPLLRILIRLTLIIVVNAIAIYIYGFILIRLEAVIRLVLSINTIRIPKRFTKVGNRIPKRLPTHPPSVPGWITLAYRAVESAEECLWNREHGYRLRLFVTTAGLRSDYRARGNTEPAPKPGGICRRGRRSQRDYKYLGEPSRGYGSHQVESPAQR